MMMDDKEILDDFVVEVRAIGEELKLILDSISKTQMKDMALFEKYGQVVDRIHGTASTLGFVELATYTKSLKDISYKCSQSKTPLTIQKTFNVLKGFIPHIETLCRVINDPEEIKKVRFILKVENSKAEMLSKTYLGAITRTSVK